MTIQNDVSKTAPAGPGRAVTRGLRAGPMTWALVFTIGLQALMPAVAPLGLPIGLGLIALCVLFNDLRLGRLAIPTGALDFVPMAALAVCAWLLLGAAWSLDRQGAASHALLFGVYVLVAVGLPSWFGLLAQSEKLTLLRPVMLCGLTGIVYLMVETTSGGWLTRLLLTPMIPIMDVGHGGIVVQGGQITEFSMTYFNRNTAAAMLVVPGALLATRICLTKRPRRIVIGLTLIACLITLLHSQSSTAALAFVSAVIVYPLSRLFPRSINRFAIAAFAIGLLAAIPLARAPHALGLDRADWMPGTFRERVAIWDWNAEEALRHPFLGLGMQSTKRLNDLFLLATDLTPHLVETSAVRRPARHPHNAFLEIWSETGLIGVLLVLALGVGLLRSIDRMSVRARPYAYALAAASAGISATGWSIWQPWLTAAMLTGMILLQLGSRFDLARFPIGGLEPRPGNLA
jgi:exopolysaccharide production protein ExoQ